MFVRQPGVRDRSFPFQRSRLRGADLVQALVDLGVDSADEERCHRGEGGQVASGGEGAFHAVEKRLDHRGVALQGEDQGDVDADPFRQTLCDGGQACLGGRDFDE